MKADDAVETVVELEIVRARVRGDLDALASVRFPLMLFGALTLASIGPAAAGGAWIALFWAIATPLGIALTARHYAGQRDRAGIGRDGRLAGAVSLALGVAAFAAGALWGAPAAAAAIGLGYLAMARVVHSSTMAWLGAGVLVLAGLLAVFGTDRPEVVLPAVIGSALFYTGMIS